MTVRRHPRWTLGEESLDILDSLATSGPMTAAQIAEDTGRKRQNVTKRMWDLKVYGCVDRDGGWGGVWHITEAGMARLVRDRERVA